MSGNSSVGNAGVYEAGDQVCTVQGLQYFEKVLSANSGLLQRNSKDKETNNADRFHEGKENSHFANDSSTHKRTYYATVKS
jgi:hypothetical protein